MKKLYKVIFITIFVLSVNLSLANALEIDSNLYKIGNYFYVEKLEFFNIVNDVNEKYSFFTKDWVAIDVGVYDEYIDLGNSVCLGTYENNELSYKLMSRSYDIINSLGTFKEAKRINEDYIQINKFDNTTLLLNNDLEILKKFPYSDITIIQDKLIVSSKKYLEIYNIKTDTLIKRIENEHYAEYLNENVVKTTVYKEIVDEVYFPFYGLFNDKTLKHIPVQFYNLEIVGNYFFCSTFTGDRFTEIIRDGAQKIFTKNMFDNILLDADFNEVDLSFIHNSEPVKLADVIYNEYTKEYFYIMYNEKSKVYYLYDGSGKKLHQTTAVPYKFASQSVLVTADSLISDGIKELHKNDLVKIGYITFLDTIKEIEPTEMFISKSLVENRFFIEINGIASMYEDTGKSLDIIFSGEYDKIFYTKDLKNYIVEKDNKYGLVSPDYNVLLDIEYDEISDFNGNFRCYKNGLCDVYDVKNQSFIYGWKYNDIRIYGSYLKVKLPSGAWSVIDDLGQIIISGGYYASVQYDYFYAKDTEDSSYTYYTFSKGKASNWASYDINVLNSLGIIPHEYDGIYQKSITREEFAEILANLIFVLSDKSIDNKVENLFTDTNSYGVNLCSYIGLLKGKTSTKFYPNDLITREEIAVIFDRTINYLNWDVSGEKRIFIDNNEISSWALDSVNKVSSVGLLVGDTNGKFNPEGNASREQAYVIMYRLYNKVK